MRLVKLVDGRYELFELNVNSVGALTSLGTFRRASDHENSSDSITVCDPETFETFKVVRVQP